MQRLLCEAAAVTSPCMAPGLAMAVCIGSSIFMPGGVGIGGAGPRSRPVAGGGHWIGRQRRSQKHRESGRQKQIDQLACAELSCRREGHYYPDHIPLNQL